MQLILIFVAIVIAHRPCLADDLGRAISLEQRLLAEQLESGKNSCRNMKAPYVQKSHCEDNAVARYKEKMAKLSRDPELYFYKKDQRDAHEGMRKNVRREVRRELNSRGYYQ